MMTIRSERTNEQNARDWLFNPMENGVQMLTRNFEVSRQLTINGHTLT
jgi:hypothetical protein